MSKTALQKLKGLMSGNSFTELIELSPQSPNINAIENVWKKFKKILELFF